MSYVNYNRHGQNIGHNSVAPHNVVINGHVVTFQGDMNQKTVDLANEQNLISHTVTGEYGTLYCTSPEAAQQVADMLVSNPNYQRGGA